MKTVKIYEFLSNDLFKSARYQQYMYFFRFFYIFLYNFLPRKKTRQWCFIITGVIYFLIDH